MAISPRPSSISALAGGLAKGLFLPVFCGSALLNMGVQPVMDFMAVLVSLPGQEGPTGPEEQQGRDEGVQAHRRPALLRLRFQDHERPVHRDHEHHTVPVRDPEPRLERLQRQTRDQGARRLALHARGQGPEAPRAGGTR
ncbi:MAG: hypothetical protein MZU91_03145 [Desulfosudis oleivorans]|nr:hypothetical protein [Desulfosudis oleivorans]